MTHEFPLGTSKAQILVNPLKILTVDIRLTKTVVPTGAFLCSHVCCSRACSVASTATYRPLHEFTNAEPISMRRESIRQPPSALACKSCQCWWTACWRLGRKDHDAPTSAPTDAAVPEIAQPMPMTNTARFIATRACDASPCACTSPQQFARGCCTRTQDIAEHTACCMRCTASA